MEKCNMCTGTGKAKFVDFSKVPNGMSMIVGDATWKVFEEEDICPTCNGFGIIPIPSNLFEKQKAIKLICN